MAIITNSASFTVADASTEVAQISIPVLPAVSSPSGKGRLIHPTLGTFDYTEKPDEWVNIDGNLIIPPVWSTSKTLGGSTSALWSGKLRDVFCEERWKAPGGLAMSAAQLRMLIAIWTNPVDPANGYVEWYPNYATDLGFKVIPINLAVGGSQGIALNDVMNSLATDGSGDVEGWVTEPVTLTLKLIEQL